MKYQTIHAVNAANAEKNHKGLFSRMYRLKILRTGRPDLIANVFATRTPPCLQVEFDPAYNSRLVGIWQDSRREKLRNRVAGYLGGLLTKLKVTHYPVFRALNVGFYAQSGIPRLSQKITILARVGWGLAPHLIIGGDKPRRYAELVD